MSGLIFRWVAPNSVPTPTAPYYTEFLSDGSRATSSPSSPTTIAGLWYRIASDRTLTKVSGGQIITFTTEGTSGAATYDPVTGDLNIPEYAGGGGAATWGGITGDINSQTDLQAELALLQPKAVEYIGYSATLGKLVDLATVEATLAELLDLSYIAPTVTLAGSPTNSVREKGDTIASLLLTATTHKTLNNITAVQFFKDASLIHSVPSPIAGGGPQPYTYATPVSDTATFSATVGDGTGTDTASLVYTFVYPYYYGSGAENLTPSQVAALTKNIVVESTSKAVTYTASNQVFYFAYPASYGALTSILDPNGFEIISGFTLRVENITGLDGNAVSYNIYELNNSVTQTNFTVTFKQ